MKVAIFLACALPCVYMTYRAFKEDEGSAMPLGGPVVGCFFFVLLTIAAVILSRL